MGRNEQKPNVYVLLRFSLYSSSFIRSRSKSSTLVIILNVATVGNKPMILSICVGVIENVELVVFCLVYVDPPRIIQ